MPVDLARFHQKLKSYPAMFLLPHEEQALEVILETLDGLFGEPIGSLPHAARIQLVRAVVQACVNATHPDE